MHARRQRQLKFESLEGRRLLSATSLVSRLIADASYGPPAIVAPAPSPQSIVAPQPSSLAPSASTRWDWLAGTDWYVPTENMLAYSTPANLSHPTPIADQTLWNITQSSGGHIEGEYIAYTSIDPSPSVMPFVGTVTAGGQVRMTFLHGQGQEPTTGVGQMRWVEGAWRVEMQMATGTSLVTTHWAYMSLADSNTTPPDPVSPPLDENLLSNEWRWLEGTRWAITDKTLFGAKSQTGAFTIDEYRNGYFWGSGTSKQPFNVLGSVTPEGNVLLIVSVNGGQPSTRNGQLLSTGAGGVMVLRSYVDKPAIGYAWSIDGATSAAAAVARLSTSALQTVQSQAGEIRVTAKQLKEITKELTSGITAITKAEAIRARASVRAIIDRFAPLS